MDLDQAEKPLRQLRKLLKNLDTNPAPEDVHMLRTRARKIEAVAAALKPADEKQTRRLLKTIKPVRKAAGGVRDMDVLTGDLLHIPQDSNRYSLVRLVEHLATVRHKSAGKLLRVVEQQSKPARRRLKKYARMMETVADGQEAAPIKAARVLESENDGGSLASDLMAELCHWPRLSAHNIHSFRLKVKELRYVLQLFPRADQGLIESLAKVKDEIGDWHDWQQLLDIAREVLDAREDRTLLAQIEAAERKKLTQALSGANTLRRRYLRAAAAQHRAS